MDRIVEAFATSLLFIVLAEFGDKTQLGLIALAASTRQIESVFSGMIVAFTVVAGLGVLVGQALLLVIPLPLLTMISGLVFSVVGLLMLQMKVESDIARPHAKGTFLAALLMIVFAELGDKTQIVTIALAARFAQPLAVFSGVLLGFVIIDGLSIILADRLGKRIPTSKVKKASAIIFIVLGIFTLLGAITNPLANLK